MKNTQVLGLLLLLGIAPSVSAGSWKTTGQETVKGLFSGVGLGMTTEGVIKLANLVFGSMSEYSDYKVDFMVSGATFVIAEAAAVVGWEAVRQYLASEKSDSDASFWAHYISFVAVTSAGLYSEKLSAFAKLIDLKDSIVKKAGSLWVSKSQATQIPTSTD